MKKTFCFSFIFQENIQLRFFLFVFYLSLNISDLNCYNMKKVIVFHWLFRKRWIPTVQPTIFFLLQIIFYQIVHKKVLCFSLVVQKALNPYYVYRLGYFSLFHIFQKIFQFKFLIKKFCVFLFIVQEELNPFYTAVVIFISLFFFYNLLF